MEAVDDSSAETQRLQADLWIKPCSLLGFISNPEDYTTSHSEES